MSILTCFLLLLYRIHTLPHTGGRGKIFSVEQEAAIVDMVVANNAIRLREIQAAVIADQGAFRNINSVSLATIERVLKRNHVRMKQIYRVPFQRNSDIVKEARFQYVQVRICYCNACYTIQLHATGIICFMNLLFFLENNGAWSWRGTSQIHLCGWSRLQPL